MWLSNHLGHYFQVCYNWKEWSNTVKDFILSRKYTIERPVCQIYEEWLQSWTPEAQWKNIFKSVGVIHWSEQDYWFSKLCLTIKYINLETTENTLQCVTMTNPQRWKLLIFQQVFFLCCTVCVCVWMCVCLTGNIYIFTHYFI